MEFPVSTIDYAWRYRSVILPVGLAIPAAFELASIASHISKNPGCVQQKYIEAKQFVVKSFTRQEGETSEVFQSRLIKNVLIGLACTIGIGALIGFTVVLPFFALPIYFSIPLAITGICSIGELIVNGPTHMKNLKAKCLKLKEWAMDAFKMRAGESKTEALRRIGKNVLITLTALAALGLACYGVSYLILYALHVASSGVITQPWQIRYLLPFQGVKGTFVGYGIIGALHGGVAVKKWQAGNKKEAFFHMVSAVLSIAFPTIYFFTQSHNEMRLHHSFLGLALQLIPLRPLQMYGSIVTFDAGMNTFFRQVAGDGGGYDLQSIVVNNLSTFVPIIAVLSGIDFIRNRLLPTKKQSEKVDIIEKEPLQKASPVITISIEKAAS